MVTQPDTDTICFFSNRLSPITEIPPSGFLCYTYRMEAMVNNQQRGRGNRPDKTAATLALPRDEELPIDSSGAIPSVITDATTGKPLSVKWELDGQLHRLDGPAMEYEMGDRVWYFEGERHREDGPAAVHADGDEIWYRHGQIHRDGGPAVRRGDGQLEWWQDGQIHRLDGPAVIEANSTEKWVIRGLLHREDGPAVTYPSGKQEWWLHGGKHRLDGPAVINADGTQQWWVNDELTPRQQYVHATAMLRRNTRQQDLNESLLAPRGRTGS